MSEDHTDEAPEQMTRFVPIQRQELVELLAREFDADPARRRLFEQLASLLQNTIHFQFNSTMERLKAAYRPLDPDPIIPSVLDSPEAMPAADAFNIELRQLLEQANFKQVTAEELEQAFDSHSLFPLSSTVDLDEFDQMLLFRRDEARRTEKVRGLSTLYRWQETEVDLYRRLVMVLRLKPEALERHRKAHRVKDMRPGKVYIKYFKNIPKADLEMVFPNTRLKMNPLDRIKVSIPLLGGLGTAGIKLLAIAGLVAGAGSLTQTDDRSMQAAGALVAVLAGYILRSVNGYKNTKIRYIQTLTEGLYFKNLDNNAGVLHHLLSAAEEEEIKEALLTYFFLLKHGKPLAKGELDHQIEKWFATRFDRHFDFEIDDGLKKLSQLELVEEKPDGLQALPLKGALEILDKAWDGNFDY